MECYIYGCIIGNCIVGQEILEYFVKVDDGWLLYDNWFLKRSLGKLSLKFYNEKVGYEVFIVQGVIFDLDI